MINIIHQGYQLIPQPKIASWLDYKFITNEPMVYDAYFFDASEFFPGNTFEKDALMFTVEPEGKLVAAAGLDQRIGLTIVDIFTRHFQAHPNGIVAFVYATADRKQLRRILRFNRLFEQQNINNLFKKATFNDGHTAGGIVYLATNPAEQEIVQAAENIPLIS